MKMKAKGQNGSDIRSQASMLSISLQSMKATMVSMPTPPQSLTPTGFCPSSSLTYFL